MSENQRNLRVAVIGAGASGIMALIKLREAGYSDVVAFEKAGDLGGTWRDNHYPGLCCDVPSLAYRYSFAPNPDWSRVFSPGPEILAYVRGVAERYGVADQIRYDNEVVRAEFRDGRWALESAQGWQGEFDVVLTATGVLHHPVYPDIPGLGDFAGPAFHTARWDDKVTLAGKRVGVIGTGSTATQITAQVIGEVAKLSLFQRTAQWIMPAPNPEYTEEQKAEFRARPELLEQEYQRLNLEQGINFADAVVGVNTEAYAKIEHLCHRNLAENVHDPVLRAKLTPNHKVGCKRLIVSEGFYRAIQKPNAELVTEPIARIEAGGVRTADGRLHELDVLVLATGFNTHQFFRPMKVVGEGGRRLDEAWAERNVGYKNVTTPGFPNWFMIGGPNSPIGNYSWLTTAVNQLGFAMKLMERLRAGNARRIAPKAEATRAFNEALDAKLPGTVWASGCKSWYIDAAGRVASWPWTYDKFLRDMAEPVLEDFDIA
jgi:cation diffusion facilitator CzcD-associated flavoprotein CzcO